MKSLILLSYKTSNSKILQNNFVLFFVKNHKNKLCQAILLKILKCIFDFENGQLSFLSIKLKSIDRRLNNCQANVKDTAFVENFSRVTRKTWVAVFLSTIPASLPLG